MADFTVIADGCAGVTLNPQGNPASRCQMVVRFNPSAGTVGARTGALSVDLGNGFATTALNGNALAAPQQTATLTPTSVNFGPVQIGTQSAPTVFTFTNTGTQPIGPLGAAAFATNNADQFVVTEDNCVNKTLNNGQSCTVSGTFRPTAAGLLSASLVVPFSAAVNSPGATASVVGNGVNGRRDADPGGWCLRLCADWLQQRPADLHRDQQRPRPAESGRRRCDPRQSELRHRR